jgi:hypothetical protein
MVVALPPSALFALPTPLARLKAPPSMHLALELV